MRLFKCAFILVILSSLALSAQKRPDPKKFELEIGLNHSFAAQKKGGEDLSYKVGFYIEGRFNLKKQPIDLGFQLSSSNVRREGLSGIFHSDYKAIGASFISNYYFLRGRKVNPYIGLGVGANYSRSIEYSCDAEWNCSEKRKDFFFLFGPRVGAKFFNRFTVGFDYMISNAYLTRIHARIGYYF